MMRRLKNALSWVWRQRTAIAARPSEAVLSNRGLITCALLVATLLILGPWLRPSVSRDFRGIHIPWSDSSSSKFLPEQAVQAPRPWRWDSVAIPLLVIVWTGMPIVWLRPRWTPHVFGLLLAVGLPALAATLWNHPNLVEFFDGEISGRQMIRTMFARQHDDMMTVRAPDRLAAFGAEDMSTDVYLQAPVHPMLGSWDYAMYGTWLISLAGAGLIATQHGNWLRSARSAAIWSGVGIVLAAAATWPRWVAEYHWARADELERANDFGAAEASLEQARQTMRCLGETRRYWVARGRLAYRLQNSPRYETFFIAHQYLQNGDPLRAEAELAPFARLDTASTAERDLMSEILGNVAVGHIAQGQPAGSKLAWQRAVALAPWKPAYRVSLAAAELAESPAEAPLLHQRMFDQLVEVGDCFVGSDVASALGDAYFEIGEFDRARAMYSEAKRLFDLPKYVNLHAQEGRLGM
jgi:tetratricopeptide (TPR) repeat protein